MHCGAVGLGATVPSLVGCSSSIESKSRSSESLLRLTTDFEFREIGDAFVYEKRPREDADLRKRIV